MKKLSVLGVIGGAALLTAAPFSLQWSHETVMLSLDSADARIGRPRTALSVAGVQRRAYRRAARSVVYGGVGAVGYGVGTYYGGHSAPTAPYYGTGYVYGPSYGGYGYPAYSYPTSYYGGYGYPAYSTAPYNPGPSFGWRIFR